MSGWFATLEAGDLDPAGLHAAVKARMADAKVLRVVGAKPAGPPLSFWLEAGEVLGQPTGQIEDSVSGEAVAVDGGWMDVRFDPDRLDTYRHSNVAQPLHTDGAYRPHAQDIALFFLERQAEAGGESLFLDGEAVADWLSREDPDLLSRLMSVEVAFGKGRGERVTTPILHRERGALKVNWNWFRVLPDQGEAVDSLREAFRQLLDRLVDEDVATAIRLETGDAVFFRDDEVLHGRKTYAAAVSGDRLLWKTYFKSHPRTVASDNGPRGFAS
jgi:alpha-ketoglutarate-dependent taurine dioxygenase